MLEFDFLTWQKHNDPPLPHKILERWNASRRYAAFCVLHTWFVDGRFGWVSWTNQSFFWIDLLDLITIFVRFLTSLLPGVRLAMPPWKLALDPGTRAPRHTRFGVASASTRRPPKDVKPKKRGSSLKCETHWPSNCARLPSWRFAGAMKLLGSRGCGGFWVIRYTIFINIESYWIILNHSWSLLTFLLSTTTSLPFNFSSREFIFFSRFRFFASWKSHLPRHPVPLTPSFKWKLCTLALGCACCIGAGACAWVLWGLCLYLAIWKRFEQGPEKKTQVVEFGQPFDLLVEGRNGQMSRKKKCCSFESFSCEGVPAATPDIPFSILPSFPLICKAYVWWTLEHWSCCVCLSGPGGFKAADRVRLQDASVLGSSELFNNFAKLRNWRMPKTPFGYIVISYLLRRAFPCSRVCCSLYLGKGTIQWLVCVLWTMVLRGKRCF